MARFSTRGREGPLRKVGANVDNTVFNRSSASARAQGEEPRRRAKPPGARGGTPPRGPQGKVGGMLIIRSLIDPRPQRRLRGSTSPLGGRPLGREGDSPQELKMLRNAPNWVSLSLTHRFSGSAGRVMRPSCHKIWWSGESRGYPDVSICQHPRSGLTPPLGE